MKRISQLPFADGLIAAGSCLRGQTSFSASQRWRNTSSGVAPAQVEACSPRRLHTTPLKGATVAPLVASGPPPKAPVPSAEHVDSRVARRRKQAELLKRGQDLRAVAGGTGGGTAKQKRFWKDVHVTHADGMTLVYVPCESITNVSLQKVSKCTSTNVPSVAQPKTSSQSRLINHILHLRLLSNGIFLSLHSRRYGIT